MPFTNRKTLLLSSLLVCVWSHTRTEAQNVLRPVSIAINTAGVSSSEGLPSLSNRPATPLQLYVSQSDTQASVQGVVTEPAIQDAAPVAGGPLRLPPLGMPNTSTETTGAIPIDATQGRLASPQPLPTGPDREGMWYLQNKQWDNAPICHHPLYFQDTMLERHGHERFPCLQPYVSGVRFFSTVPLLPYLMTLHPPKENIYNLGHFRPGTAAPLLRERPPYDKHAMQVELISAAAVAVAIP